MPLLTIIQKLWEKRHVENQERVAGCAMSIYLTIIGARPGEPMYEWLRSRIIRAPQS